jgi:hypothetical protein
MSELSARQRESRFRSFCQAWEPTRHGILSRTWKGHRCRIGYEPGGHWASLDGKLFDHTFTTGNDALRALFEIVETPEPAEAVG